MSVKMFKSRCKNLKDPCQNINPSGEKCDPHISLRNLQELSKNLEIILKQPNDVSDDWREYKKLDMGKNGFINMTMNFQEISDELAKVKALINTFNMTRKNLWKFKDTIKNFKIGIPKLERQEKQLSINQKKRRA